jgi:hypothetical protein
MTAVQAIYDRWRKCTCYHFFVVLSDTNLRYRWRTVKKSKPEKAEMYA